MEVYTFGMIFIPILYIVCNIYVHKKRAEGKWTYTIITTLTLVIYIFVATISHILLGGK